MLKVPVVEIPVDHFSIIGIDPGSDTMGISEIKVDFKTQEIIETTAWTITASKLVNDTTWLSVNHSFRLARIHVLKERLINIFNKIDPAIIVCESPFYNPRRPNAYGVLVEVLTAVRESVIEHDVWKALYLIDPSSIKKSVGAPGNADKTVMKEKIKELECLKYKGSIELASLDEHSVDAIATAYCKYKNVFIN